MASFDLTPSPNVLIALTHTPMTPLDALCELVDNAIDSFSIAKLRGAPVIKPVVAIHLPKVAEIEAGQSVLRVQDNGPGMTEEQAERSIKAGFSGNNPFDTLGLFGMGFNIATGKLGRETRLTTWTQGSNEAVSVTFDLEMLVQSKSYLVPSVREARPATQESGTVVEVGNWWPEGHPNAGFVLKLVRYGAKKIGDELGRRYATILRKGEIRLYVNDQKCEAFEHCVWSDHRSVTRHSSQIPAVFRFDKVIGNQRRCITCFALVPPVERNCPGCGLSSFRTVEERVQGWIGIQRFDHETEFGIDLVRNGRTIRVAEKSAFFEFTDEFKKSTKDYPIDQQYGRIIGEVNLNHVPVDFMKQDFQRSSSEWQRAMSFLRGDSSLQPNQPGADKNESPLFKLYQGYRRVRTPGKTDLYMGYWDQEDQKPKRISREIERQYLDRFVRREPGYFDDTEWFKLVDKADVKPLEDLVNCPSCQNQNLKSADVCGLCGNVLIGKKCLKEECGQTIAESTAVCPHCSTSQFPVIETPWNCKVCGSSNVSDALVCGGCSAARGLEDPLSKDYLLANSNLSDDLTLKGATVTLPDGSLSLPIDVLIYLANSTITRFGGDARNNYPLVVFRSEKLEIFLDPAHSFFKSYQVRLEDAVAEEFALFLLDNNRRFVGGKFGRLFSLTTLRWEITRKFWEGRLESSADGLRRDVDLFTHDLLECLPKLLKGLGSEIFESVLTEGDQKELSLNIINAGRDISMLAKMIEDASYLSFLEPVSILAIFDRYAACFFDGAFWRDGYMYVDELSASAQEQIRLRIRGNYRNWLEDVITVAQIKSPSPLQINRCRHSLHLLREKIV